jgi:hypothetical protein
MKVAKAQHWAVEPQEQKLVYKTVTLVQIVHQTGMQTVQNWEEFHDGVPWLVVRT